MPTVDDEGYLLDPDQWTEEWAAQQAHLLNLSLDDDHWFVTPDARHAMRRLEQRYQTRGRQRMFELFPYGYVAQACRIAGMKRPRAWSTG